MTGRLVKLGLWIILLIFFATPLTAAETDGAAKTGPSRLINPDCLKCHGKETRDIAEAGMAHKTKVSCSDCHVGHRPQAFENIPPCSNCHFDSSHFELERCLNCHRNPHRPTEIKLSRNITAACLTCHEEQGTELTNFQSYHSSLACSDCHHEHGEIPECVSCHLSHADFIVQNDCKKCHQPHKPLDVTYGQGVTSEECGSCHDAALALLEATSRKHGELSCASCHESRHKMIPQCQDCHGSPHPEGIMRRFQSCGECHETAHDLMSVKAAKPQEGATLVESTLVESTLVESTLVESTLVESTLEESTLEESTLEESALEESALEESALEESALKEPGLDKTSPNRDKGSQARSKSAGGLYAVQLGSFLIHGNALKMSRDVKANSDFDPRIVERTVKDKRYFRVRIGDFPSLKEAKRARQEFERNGYPDCFVVQIGGEGRS